MPCHSSRFDPRVGPIIHLSVSEPGTQAAVSPNKVLPVSALIDTGAEVTCIGSAVAKTLGLRPIGMRQMVSATHAIPANVYVVDLLVHLAVLVPIQVTTVIEFNQPSGTSFQAVLGRDVLCKGAFSMSFDGHYTFCL